LNYEESEVELVIVDGIFGTGLVREFGEPEKCIIQLINASEKSVLP